MLNFPADYGLPEPQPTPQRDQSQAMEQPYPRLCTYVRWDKKIGIWYWDGAFTDKFRELGIHAPTTYLFQHDAIRALQRCCPCRLLSI